MQITDIGKVALFFLVYMKVGKCKHGNKKYWERNISEKYFLFDEPTLLLPLAWNTTIPKTINEIIVLN